MARRLAAMVLVALAAGCSGCSASGDKPPQLSRITESIPIPDPLPEPPPPPPPTVEDVSDDGCTTKVVAGLSQQIIAEGNCLEPGAFVALPAMPNVSLDPSVFPYMSEPARDALVKAVGDAKGGKLAINSMLRTVAQQYLLFRWFKSKRCGITLAAEPGQSNHQSGLALDVSEPERWRPRLTKNGFRWMGRRDRWHFDFVGGNARRLREDGSLDVEAFQRLWNRNNPEAEPLEEDGSFGPDTEEALRNAPAQGFPLGASCVD